MIIHWTKFEVEGAEYLPDWYDDEGRWYYKAKVGALTLAVFPCYFYDMFTGWGWCIEKDGKEVAEKTFRSDRVAIPSVRGAKLSVTRHVRNNFPAEWEAYCAGSLFPKPVKVVKLPLFERSA